MPHVNLRRAYMISDLRHRAPFPAIATVTADETLTTASARATKSSSNGLSPAQIGASVSAVLASLLVVGFLLYKFRTRKSQSVQSGQQKKGPLDEKSSSNSEVVKVDLFRASPVFVEKPKAVYLSEPTTTYDAQVGWVPQIKAYKGVPVTSKQYEKNMRYPRALAMWEKAQTSPEGSLKQPSPPPSYDIPRAPSPPRQPRSLTPPPAQKPTPRPAELMIPPPGSENHLPSPMRSASLPETIALTPLAKRTSSLFAVRLMTVCNTFVPKLSDEISVTIGESVRLMEEYDDGWCLVQRTGSESSKGIIPRFCLTERRR